MLVGAALTRTMTTQAIFNTAIGANPSSSSLYGAVLGFLIGAGT